MWVRSADMEGSGTVTLFGLLTVIASIMTNTMASECLSDAWKYDEDKSRCLMISMTGLDYNSARHECGVKNGGLLSPDSIHDITTLEKLFSRSLGSLTFWSEHLLVRHGSGYRLFDGHGVQMALSSCPQCSSLLPQIPPSGVLDGSRVCAHVTRNTSLTWTVSNCSAEHHFVCHYSKHDTDDPSLAPRDIAAIAVGAFILLCFFVTLAIDFYLHIKRQKRKYLEENKVVTVRPVDFQQDDKKASPLDFSVSNFGSNVELIPTNVSLSHV